MLSDERQRAVYDVWAKELQYRYVDGVARRVRGSAYAFPEASESKSTPALAGFSCPSLGQVC